MLTKPAYTSYPRVQIWRRGIAFSIDFVGVWLLSFVLGGYLPGFQLAQMFVFVIAWLVLRVLLVDKNRGQTLGRWALDMKVLDARLGRVPGLQALFKREAITGLGALLAAIGISNIGANFASILLIIPLVIDCGIACSDPELRQSLHDRLARTIVVSTRRGYSLDIKVRRLIDSIRRHMRK